MTPPGTWRSVRTLMLLTLNVAAIAAGFRYLVGSGLKVHQLPPLALFIAIASVISWTILRTIATEMNARSDDYDRKCPVCRRDELRPLVKPGEGIFQPVSSYRCSACLTTVRIEGGSRSVEPRRCNPADLNSAGIRFLDDPIACDEIEFLDDPPRLPG